MKIKRISNQQSGRSEFRRRGLGISRNFQSFCTLPRHSRIACITDILIAFDLPPICPRHHRGKFRVTERGFDWKPPTPYSLHPLFHDLVPLIRVSSRVLQATGTTAFPFSILPSPRRSFLRPAMPSFLRSLAPCFLAIQQEVSPSSLLRQESNESVGIFD